MTRGSGLLLGSFSDGDQGRRAAALGPRLRRRKGDNARWHEDRRRGGVGDQDVKPLLEGLGVDGWKGDDVRT
jgi:hypothetical protein